MTEPVEHLREDRVLLTGGGGFLGSFLRERLEEKVAALCVPRRREHDLRREEVVAQLLEAFRPTVVIHAAAQAGGIGHNVAHPAEMFDDNVRMNFLVQERARLCGVRKFVGIGTISSYPKNAPLPFRESDLWNGLPDESVGSYGLAKRLMLAQSQAYARQYGFNAIHLLLVNLYGPRDEFAEGKSHAVPALIQRFCRAADEGWPEVVCWGDGTPTREFLYVEDAADAILRATALYHSPEPVNIGAGEELSMREVAQAIAETTGFKGNLVWDPSKPGGQPRRRVDTTRAQTEFGFRASVPFREGLRRTVEWYRTQESS